MSVGGVRPGSVGGAAILPFGDTALLVEVGSNPAAHRLAACLETDREHVAGIRDIVIGFHSVLVQTDPLIADLAGVSDWLTRLCSSGTSFAHEAPDLSSGTEGDGDLGAAVGTVDSPARPPVTIPTVFDGPDLDEVARSIRTSTEQVVELLTSVTLQVAFLGFAPGFPYLIGLPPELAAIPRRSSPRTQVPAGSVAVAGGFASIYPRSSPGGWQLLGHTDVALFDPDQSPFALLRAGDAVRFTRAGAGIDTTTGTMSNGDGERWPSVRTDPLRASTDRFIRILDPGMLTLVEDAGRTCVAAIGVPTAGAADPDGLRLANRLVGNPDTSAVLEITAHGPTVRFSAAGHAAVVHEVDLDLDGKRVAADAVFPVMAGQVLTIGPVRDGLRSYLAVAGGLLGPSVFGSCSSDVLAGLGVGPVQDGDEIDVGTPDHPHGRLTPVGVEPVVRVLAGPHTFSGASCRSWSGWRGRWTASRTGWGCA